MSTRRITAATIAFLLAAFLLAGCTATPTTKPTTGATAAPSAPSSTTAAPAEAEFARLEREFDAELGVYAVETGTGREVAHRADQRFAYASTIKALATGAVLRRHAVGELEQVVTYARSDLVEYSPVTGDRVGTGMTLREVMDAAVRYSDNTAGNLLFRDLGGPEGLNAALRAIGDTTTKAARVETELNEAVPGDERDTSTPRALAGSLRAYALGDALPEDRRAVLVDLLRRNTTGAELIRAGVPEGWVVGDKTGSGGYGTRNDIAVVWPPDRAPIVLAVLSDRDTADADHDDALIARAAAAAVNALR
ncbi:class A beta-lactamase [Saccharothrix coeruleofusca]|uniref:Beta-lactamase class A catalytic domain-containing protein n=1 Tax=Saccharothrix coeruleofusca TaxID=33919 RepID=A0A918EFW6_9PSEU|nr:class A beta-lactamase [Saccharothrix coeruleofusca]GGP76512.1 hypothetical protein GCM10010185_57820 [Saccharothrix coeruleofusca]